ncbi:MAG TPA: transcription termination factor NusA [Patescibacteria group bacterium]|jgi:N utilization substance protein A|nr:transcription termination factor NusA [Patescibacteria group bacterium]
MQDLNLKQLAMSIKQIAEEKNLSEEIVHDIIEQAIAAAYRRDFGEKEQAVRASVNANTGDVTVFVSKTVVEDGDVNDSTIEITLSDAQKIRKDAALEETVEVTDHPTSFGRVAAQTAKQVILQKLREAEREVVLSEYEDKIGTTIVGTVQRVEPRVVRVELGKTTGIIPQSEQIPGEYYGIGSRIKVYLKDVEHGPRGPQLILSRASEQFIEYLFRQEVPEMESGAVEIKAIAREAGKRTKIAVHSTVPGVDPVGTFVGGRGSRVQAVMNEVGEQERIDIVTFSDDPKTFITNALNPATIAKLVLDEANKRAKVIVDESQLSIVIGRGGQNVRLASRLTGYELDIESASDANIAPAAPAKPKTSKHVEDALLSAIEATNEGEETKS